MKNNGFRKLIDHLSNWTNEKDAILSIVVDTYSMKSLIMSNEYLYFLIDFSLEFFSYESLHHVVIYNFIEPWSFKIMFKIMIF